MQKVREEGEERETEEVRLVLYLRSGESLTLISGEHNARDIGKR